MQTLDKSFPMTFSEAVHINHRHAKHAGSIPNHSLFPTAVILLFIPSRERRKTLNWKLTLQQGTGTNNEFVPKILTAELETIISTYIVDMFLYGSQFVPEEHINLKRLYKHLPDDLDLFMFSEDSVTIGELSSVPISFSRCGESNVPFLPSAFKKATETPNKANECSTVSTINYPFSTRLNLQSTAMKLVFNCQHSIKLATADPSIFDGTPREVTARLLGISKATVYNINGRLKNNQLLTPKKKNRKPAVLSKIDGFDKDFITRKIQESYKNNIAPDAKRIYDVFMTMKQEQYEAEYRRKITSSATPRASLAPTLLSPIGTTVASRAASISRPTVASRAASISRPTVASRTGSTTKSTLGSRAGLTTRPTVGSRKALTTKPTVASRKIRAASTNTPTVAGNTRLNTRQTAASGTALTATPTVASGTALTATPTVASGTALTATPTVASGTATPASSNSGQINTCPAQPVPELEKFKCSMRTFKRLLRLMGYRYRKIDNRAAIMQRPELTRWRGMHLKRLKQNDDLENPKMLVYIDETWIDSNAKIAKGWQPRYFDKFRDMAAFSYDKYKVGRGVRLIVLAAVTKDGIIADSVRVFKVSASTTADDYHKNVGEAEFDRWMAELIAILDRLGGSWLIIMDNASYHSAKEIPKKSARKQEVYDFIKAQIEANRYVKTLPDIKDTRLWDLHSMLDELVALPSMKNRIYKLDLRIAESGHEIVRLPPYHCHLNPIELVWKDVKHEVLKKNTEQKIDVIKPIVESELKNYGADKVKPHWDHVIHLRARLWIEDGVYDSFITPLVITDDDDDDDDDDSDEEELFSENEEEFEVDDNIPYGDDSWYVDDGIDLEGPQFDHESEIAGHKHDGPPPKRARCVPQYFQ